MPLFWHSLARLREMVLHPVTEKRNKLFITAIFNLLLLLSFLSLRGQVCRVNIDLRSVQKDQLTVELTAPEQGRKRFCFPKIVPGTYAIYDFGRFVKDVQAFDSIGNKIIISRLNANVWETEKNIHKITYRVDDTFDASAFDNFVFQPAGSSFEKDSAFVLNPYTTVGFFEGHEEDDYELSIKYPEGFYASTSLPGKIVSGSETVFFTPSYYELADNPILFCVPDTQTLQLSNTTVLVSVYSPDNKKYAKQITEHIQDVLKAIERYMGGKLPVSQYSFLIYLFDPSNKRSYRYGALEHNHSSMYYLPIEDSEELSRIIKEFAAHEFFHILTPLNIHSKEIAYFDFLEPKMSRHLWLYEGITEYQAQHCLMMYGLIRYDEFWSQIQQKIQNSRTMYQDKLPFTEMSLGVLSKYEKQYDNVYEKGALIGLCLDILLRDLSQGEMGLQHLLRKLSQNFGAEKPFEDSTLFKVIEEYTFPEVGTFLQKYVAGKEPLPLNEIFNKIGVQYYDQFESESFSLGNITLSVNLENNRLIISSLKDIDNFGKQFGFKIGDELILFNGKPIDVENYSQLFREWLRQVRSGDELQIVVNRPAKNNKPKLITLSAKAVVIKKEERFAVKSLKNPTTNQLKIRNAWLKPY
ncbi:MAG: peptidase M61 [Bacteroidia bacterium]|nr:peptidase M61 [Bacteroidia bacterium]